MRLADEDAPLTVTNAAVAVAASALLLGLGTWSDHFGLLQWIAPVPVLAVALRASLARGALCAFFAAALGGSGLAIVYRGTALPTAALLGAAALGGVGFAAVVALARAIHRVLTRRLAAPATLAVVAFVLAFGAGAALLDWANSATSPHGTAGSAAYSQAGNALILQLVALGGLPAVDFVLAAVPAALALAWTLWIDRGDRRAARAALVLALAFVAVPAAYGALRLSRAATSPTVRVGVAASDVPAAAFAAHDEATAAPIVDGYLARIDRLAADGARVIVLPEELVGTTPAYAARVYADFADAARRHGVTVVAGLRERLADGTLRNHAAVFGPDGATRLVYDKIHLIPGVEPMPPGHAPGLLDGEPRLGVAICKDLDFVDLARAHAAGGTRLLLAPAWDFGRDGWLHGRMAVVRAVEAGAALARSARDGLVTVSDAYGRVVARNATDGHEASAVADVALGPGTTFYARHGDWFVAACALLLLALAAAATYVRLRRLPSDT
ncbi:MAG TPA: nitrilase-related carbon-nitrogen hydrolase [Polyangia bacterium]